MSLKQIDAYYNNLRLAKQKKVAVGIIKGKASGRVYANGKTALDIGTIHEYGASFMHPGGTWYTIGKNGQAVFTKKGNPSAVGVTKPHQINIPQRSFLRTPFIVKKGDLEKLLRDQFKLIVEQGKDAIKALKTVGIGAEDISKGAFTTGGYGQWKGLKASTKRKKGSSQTLIDTGTLRSSITSEVR